MTEIAQTNTAYGGVDNALTERTDFVVEKMSVSDHIIDLRNMVLKSVISFSGGLVVSAIFANHLYQFYTYPARNMDVSLNYLNVTEGFSIQIEMVLFTAIILTLPQVLFHVWGFVKPALEMKELRFARLYLFAMLSITGLAVIYGYNLLIPLSLRFFSSINGGLGLQSALSASYYMAYFKSLFLALILAFQLPMVIFSILKAKILPMDMLTKNRKFLYFGITALMFALVPGDIFLSAMMVAPVIVMLELAIFIARVTTKPTPA